MALIEVQIRTDRFCRLIEGEINSTPLSAPTIDEFPNNLIERIECKDCQLRDPGKGLVGFGANFVAFFYDSLDVQLRPAGSFGVGSPKSIEMPGTINLSMKNDNGQNWRIEYEVRVAIRQDPLKTGVLPLFVGGIKIAAADIVGNDGVFAIRIATQATDLDRPVVSNLGAAEWSQTVPAELIVDTVRSILDNALDDAVRPPPDPPAWEWWKPKPKHKELRKEGPARAAWFSDQRIVVVQGDVTAVDACPIADIDIGIELTLTVEPRVGPGNTLRTRATLTWEADRTWCSIAFGLLWGFPVGIAVFIGVKNGVSDTILGKPINAGGFAEIHRDDDSITFEQVAGPPPPPSPEFKVTALDVVAEGVRTFGTLTPKVRATLKGSATPPEAGIRIDCRLRSVGLKLNPAEVVLWSVPGDKKRLDVRPRPVVFLDKVQFDPPSAWKIEAKDFLKSAADSTPGDVLVVLKDPDTGRLPAGTLTSMYLPTSLGVRWVNLGTIPEMRPELLEDAQRLMNAYCDSITNPWAEGLTKLEWVDPLVDPDYRDRLRYWGIGLQDLPAEARIELVAINERGRERRIGVVEGMRNAVLEVVTSPNESLALRVPKSFSAPRPTVARGWFVPTKGVADWTEEHVRAHLVAQPQAVAKEEVGAAVRSIVGATRVGWATLTPLKTGERFVQHDKKLIVGVVRGIERIQ